MTGGVAGRDVAVVTPWYPTSQLPFRGAFVRTMVAATAPGCDRVTIYHCDEWPARVTPAQEAALSRAHAALLPRASRVREEGGGAWVSYLPVPVPRGLTYPELARRHEQALGQALGGAALDASVVHAHQGLPSGWAVLPRLRPDARLVVTEHASFLDRILSQPGGLGMYEAVLSRCAALFAVGTAVRDRLAAALPEHAHKISMVPNAISFDEPRPAPVTELRRWLYVGALNAHKGVPLLLEAFAKCRAEDPGLTLTLVGEGELAQPLAKRAAELGLSEAVTFTGAVPPDEALRLMREHDLLVHASRSETFGVAVVEAVAAGLPVLVTRCGGPEQTLAGIEGAAGELIAVEESEGSLVEGYRRLRDRFPHGLDLPLAQRTLDQRYGFPAVARAHHRVWFGEG